jgi:hypothetical protein
MSTEITVEWDSRDLAELGVGARAAGYKTKLGIGLYALERALGKAGSEAARAMKAESSRIIRSRKQMRVAAVNRALPLTFPTSKEITRLAWRMDVAGGVVPVAAYPHRQTKKGVSVQINKGTRRLIQHAFIATMKSGHLGVFMRDGRFGRNNNSKLERISEAYTTRVSDVFADAGMVPAVMDRTQKVFGRAFHRLMKAELTKRRGGGAR